MSKKTATKAAPLTQAANSESKIIAIHVSPLSKRVYVRSRLRVLAIAAFVSAIPWVLLALIYFGFFSRNNSVSAGDASRPSYVAPAGPWGRLDCYDFVTDPPSEFLTDDLFPPCNAVWRFGPISREELTKFFDRLDLKPDLRAHILASGEFSTDQGWILWPSEEILFGIPPAARSQIYSKLSQVQGLENNQLVALNQRQVDPFIFKPALLDAWLAEAQLNPAIVANLKKLLYPHESSVLLADTASLMKTIPSQDDRRKLLSVLLRRSTVMANLRIDPESDIAALTRYWGVGDGQREVQPLLESLKHNPGGMKIDLTLLLPSFARNRLYMYPLPSSDPLASHRDCHWTAFNFFKRPHDDRFADPEFIKAAMANDYRDVAENEPRQLGDIAMLGTPEGKYVHSCVYIADDLYYSKNGPSHISPWVLMHIADVKALFPAYEGLVIKHIRLKKN